MLTLLALLPAHAADVDPFRPSGSLASGKGSLQAESPFVLGEGFGTGVNVSFAQDLAVERVEGAPDRRLVANVLPIELYGAYTLEDLGLRVEAFAPVYASVSAPASGFVGPSLGDVRVQANIHLADVSEALSFSVVPRIELPTGMRTATTRRGFQVGAAGVAGGTLPYDIGWLANAGFTAAGADDLYGVGTGSSLDFVGSAFWTAREGMRVGVELDSQVGLVKRGQGRNTTGSWHVWAQNRLDSGIGLTVGAGSGLIGGVGAPGYRVFTALTYQVTVRDTDEDGLLDKVDACVEDPEDFDDFEDTDGCPEPDNDGDGVLDGDDRCPLEPEDPDGWEDADGCPDPDNDGDGVLDGDDRCPIEPEDRDGWEDADGCPDPDNDGDG
ncbi:MAG: hypothetical protein KC656_24335, partial [Myxococcales bacterium]|nr:hypothetical protein [Myxococcales bacterium]